MIARNRRGDELLELLATLEEQLETPRDAPLTHSFVVAKSERGWLLVFNRWRQHWEFPAGVIEADESPRACAAREFYEETAQVAETLTFEGIIKLRLQPEGRLEYGAFFSCSLGELKPLVPNAEIEEITVWDLKTDIGYVDEIDRALIALCR